jgi:hypothetical protein
MCSTFYRVDIDLRRVSDLGAGGACSRAGQLSKRFTL